MTEPASRFAVEGAGSTFVHPIGLTMLIACGALLILLPRRIALWGFILLICFVSTRQAVAVSDFNFYFPRIMVLVFGVTRGVARGELLAIRLNRLDWLVILFGAWYFAAGAINWEFSPFEMKMRSGYITEMVGTYFLVRMLMRNPDDVRSTIVGLAIVSVPLLGFFIIEYQTGRNVFSVFGGVPEFTVIRNDRLRCQGAFGHPILAGVFWASIFPLMLGVVLERRRHKGLCALGAIAALGLVVLCASSTPVLGVAAAAAGWLCFPSRRYSRHAFAVAGAVIVVLHLVMKAPVWSLIQRVNITSGSTGYHRYILVDGFITHAHEWWLIGSRLGTDHWGHFTFDTANQFVAVGVAAGIGALALFIAITVSAMFASGRIAKTAPHLGWAIGVSVFTMIVCFFGISIWGQMHFAWALPVAMAGGLGFQPLRVAVSTKRALEASRVRNPRPCVGSAGP